MTLADYIKLLRTTTASQIMDEFASQDGGFCAVGLLLTTSPDVESKHGPGGEIADYYPVNKTTGEIIEDAPDAAVVLGLETAVVEHLVELNDFSPLGFPEIADHLEHFANTGQWPEAPTKKPVLFEPDGTFDYGYSA